jgi:hypothetical protein
MIAILETTTLANKLARADQLGQSRSTPHVSKGLIDRRESQRLQRSMIALAACVNHPEREALGVCVRCRTRVCTECVTKVDGINHCVTCLAIMAVETTRASTIVGRERFVVTRLAIGVLCLVALSWVLLDIMLPGAS